VTGREATGLEERGDTHERSAAVENIAAAMVSGAVVSSRDVTAVVVGGIESGGDLLDCMTCHDFRQTDVRADAYGMYSAARQPIICSFF